MNETVKQIAVAIALIVFSIVILYISNKVKDKYYDLIVTIAFLFYLAGVAIIVIATLRFF